MSPKYSDPLSAPSRYAKLPFVVRPVLTASDARASLLLRQSAYSRHEYEESFKAQLAEPDEVDLSGCSTTFVAVDKSSGVVLGTLRLTTNFDFPQALPVEAPQDPCLDEPFTYFDRFAVAEGAPELVVHALIKASWLWSKGRDSRWHVAMSMAPLIRKYRRWAGLQVLANGEGVRLNGYREDKYYLLGSSLVDAQAYLRNTNPAFGVDFLELVHPDIQVHGTASSPVWRNSQLLESSIA